MLAEGWEALGIVNRLPDNTLFTDNRSLGVINKTFNAQVKLDHAAAPVFNPDYALSVLY